MLPDVAAGMNRMKKFVFSRTLTQVEWQGTTHVKGDLVTGPKMVDYAVPALAAGTYTFTCSIHPNMTGTLTAGS